MGVTPPLVARYNNLGMIPDAPSKSQFEPAGVLDPLSGLSAPLSGSVAVAGASKLVR
jgi:hypothetical protein